MTGMHLHTVLAKLIYSRENKTIQGVLRPSPVVGALHATGSSNGVRPNRTFSLFSHTMIPSRLTGVQQVDLFDFFSHEGSSQKWASLSLSPRRYACLLQLLHASVPHIATQDVGAAPLEEALKISRIVNHEVEKLIGKGSFFMAKKLVNLSPSF